MTYVYMQLITTISGGKSNYGKFTVRGRAAGLGCLVAVLTIG